ncbi:MAG: hypothetical protein RXR43_12595 [Sulfolobus sp.]
MIPYLMTGTAHEGGSVDGRVVVFPSTSPKDLRVTVYDPLARGGIRSKDKLRHG